MDYSLIKNKILTTNMTPTEYEIFCTNILKNQMTPYFTSAKNIVIEHNKIIEKDNQRYQFDIYFKFTSGICNITMAAECKRYTNKVSREKIQAFRQKINDASISKGIYFSTSGFQKGAITYASTNGIALSQISTKGDINILCKSLDEINPLIGVWVYIENGSVSCRPMIPECTDRFVDWASNKTSFK